MGDYHYLYLKKDVLLLADVVEKSIDTCLKFYKLDPCHYFSSPVLNWDTMVKVSGVKSEQKFRYWHLLIYWKRIEMRDFLHW